MYNFMTLLQRLFFYELSNFKNIVFKMVSKILATFNEENVSWKYGTVKEIEKL